jgi:hypothetical protein
MSACSATTGTDVGQDLQPHQPEALEGVRRRARLEGAAAQQRRTGGPGHDRGLIGLFAALHGAGPGDQREGVRPDRHLVVTRAHPDRGPLGVVLAAHQLVGVGDPVDVGDSAQGAQVEVVERVDVADQPDDRAHQAARDERLATDLLDPSDDRGDVLLRGVGRHHHDHRANVRVGPRAPGAESGVRTGVTQS